MNFGYGFNFGQIKLLATIFGEINFGIALSLPLYCRIFV